jgi:cation diffusion facilitator family transporter
VPTVLVNRMSPVRAGLVAAGVGTAINIVLAIVKIVTGVVGNSYALIADGIESTTDIISSLIVWTGLKISSLPADEDHPFGHGKAESIAGMLVAAALLAAAVFMAVQCIREIITPHHAPAWFTLLVLALVILTKEALYRSVLRVGQELTSTAMYSDAWHHRSDALTSAAAFVGISIALIGGPGYETADDWAALLACGIVLWNGQRILRLAINEIMDASVPTSVVDEVRRMTNQVEGVRDVEKCRVRKSGPYLSLDIHVVVDGNITVRKGHDIAHRAKDLLLNSPFRINDVTVHIEPD